MEAGARLALAGAIGVVAALAGATASKAQTCSPPGPDFPPSASGTTFNLTVSGLSPADANRAIGYWTGCPTYGSGIPGVSLGGSGGIPVTVRFVGGVSQTQNGRCGDTAVEKTPDLAGVASIDIRLYAFQSNGDPCNPYYDELAHELGHAFGLGDATPGATCEGHIMGTRQRSTTRAVDSNDCSKADAKWRLPGEPPPEGGGDGSSPRPCV